MIINDIKQLRKFGFILVAGISFFGVGVPFLRNSTTPLWPMVLGGFLLMLTLIQPIWLKAIYQPWMKLGHTLGWINTRIILGLIYFMLITPMGILLRLIGKDPMDRCFDKSLASYRKTLVATSDPKQMEKPF